MQKFILKLLLIATSLNLYTSTETPIIATSQKHAIWIEKLKNMVNPGKRIDKLITDFFTHVSYPLWSTSCNDLTALCIIVGAHISNQKNSLGKVIPIDPKDIHFATELRKYFTTEEEIDRTVKNAFDTVFEKYQNEKFTNEYIMNAALIGGCGSEPLLIITFNNLMLHHNPIHFALDHFDAILEEYVKILNQQNRHHELLFGYRNIIKESKILRSSVNEYSL